MLFVPRVFQTSAVGQLADPQSRYRSCLLSGETLLTSTTSLSFLTVVLVDPLLLLHVREA